MVDREAIDKVLVFVISFTLSWASTNRGISFASKEAIGISTDDNAKLLIDEWF